MKVKAVLEEDPRTVDVVKEIMNYPFGRTRHMRRLFPKLKEIEKRKVQND